VVCDAAATLQDAVLRIGIEQGPRIGKPGRAYRWERRAGNHPALFDFTKPLHQLIVVVLPPVPIRPVIGIVALFPINVVAMRFMLPLDVIRLLRSAPMRIPADVRHTPSQGLESSMLTQAEANQVFSRKFLPYRRISEH
jgi:hypothetical protein